MSQAQTKVVQCCGWKFALFKDETGKKFSEKNLLRVIKHANHTGFGNSLSSKQWETGRASWWGA